MLSRVTPYFDLPCLGSFRLFYAEVVVVGKPIPELFVVLEGL